MAKFLTTLDGPGLEGRRAPESEALADAMPEQAAFSVDFSRAGDARPHLGEGWGDFAWGGRATAGARSVLSLPPMSLRGDVTMTLRLQAADCRPEDTRFLSVRLNGREIAVFPVIGGRCAYALRAPAGGVDAVAANLVELVAVDAGPPSGFIVRRLDVAQNSFRLYEAPRRAAPAPPSLPPAELAMRFQSLGHTCEFGLFQRRCGAEPVGLLRFSAIRLSDAIDGIGRDFADIGDADQLSFYVAPDGHEYRGKHNAYGLYYHASRRVGEIDLERFAVSESRRLRYLARLLIEQIDGAEKIFVAQRRAPNLSLAEAMALLSALRARHSRVRLMWVTAGGAERGGQVESLGPGFFHGYVDRLAPKEDSNALSFASWLAVCSTCYRLAEEEG